jgi:hypothetical protein
VLAAAPAAHHPRCLQSVPALRDLHRRTLLKFLHRLDHHYWIPDSVEVAAVQQADLKFLNFCDFKIISKLGELNQKINAKDTSILYKII